MSTKYKATEIDKAYFLTVTTQYWCARNYAELDSALEIETVFMG